MIRRSARIAAQAVKTTMVGGKKQLTKQQLHKKKKTLATKVLEKSILKKKEVFIPYFTDMEKIDKSNYGMIHFWSKYE